VGGGGGGGISEGYSDWGNDGDTSAVTKRCVVVLGEVGLSVGLSEGESDWGNDRDTFAEAKGRIVVSGVAVERGGGGGALLLPPPELKSQEPYMTPLSSEAK
jgi:hypothetical protein